MSKKTNQQAILLIALVSFIAFAGLATAEATENELFSAPISADTPADIFDGFVSDVWQFMSAALSMDARATPSAVSTWNH